MNPRVLSALKHLNDLIDRGHYFNPALGEACTKYGLDSIEMNALVQIYDSQG